MDDLNEQSTHYSTASDAFTTVELRDSEGNRIEFPAKSLGEAKDASGHEHANDGKFASSGGGGGNKGSSKGAGKGGSTKKPTYHHDAIAKTKEARQARLDAWEEAKTKAGESLDEFAGVATLLQDQFNETEWPDDDESDHHAALADIEIAVGNVTVDPKPEDVNYLTQAIDTYREHNPEQAAKFDKIASKLKSHMRDYIEHRKAMNEIKQARC